MPLEPDMQSFITQLKKTGLPDITKMTAAEARVAADLRVYGQLPVLDDKDVAITNRMITVEGVSLPIRVYSPKAKTNPLPALVFFHGGGFVLSTLDEYDHLCVEIAKLAGCRVISVGYRLAPEFPFPIPADDCYNAASWVFNNAESLALIQDKIFIGGDSAGGCLAAVVALMARDRNVRQFSGQILIYPALNTNFDTASYREFGETFLTRSTLIWFWEQYLQNKSDINNPYAIPFKTNSFADLPPALVITAECDPLRDEGESYAAHLKKSHSLYEYYCCDGMIHGFAVFSEVVVSAKRAVNDMISKIAMMMRV